MFHDKWECGLKSIKKKKKYKVGLLKVCAPYLIRMPQIWVLVSQLLSIGLKKKKKKKTVTPSTNQT
jgi:hypothetical protein